MPGMHQPPHEGQEQHGHQQVGCTAQRTRMGFITRPQNDDEHKRNLLIDAGYDVIVWHYAEKPEELVTRRKDVFRKI